MKNDSLLKEEARYGFKQRYWLFVIIALVVTLMTRFSSGLSDAFSTLLTIIKSGLKMPTSPKEIADLISIFINKYTILRIASEIAIIGPLLITVKGIYTRLMKGKLGEDEGIGTFFKDIFDNYARKLGAYWWEKLWTILWTLLLIIPGIIKEYSYAMTSYLIAEYDGMSPRKAMMLSMRMMDGHKWDLFDLQLSFIGWYILNALTLGVLGIFYIEPYTNAAYANFYLEVKRVSIENGVISEEELLSA